VQAPALLIVGGDDEAVIDLNRAAMQRMHAPVRLEIVRGATHLFEEPGTLEQVAQLALDWCRDHLRSHGRRQSPEPLPLLRPYWKPLTLACAAMVAESAAEVLEPWPLKVIFDHVLGSKPMPRWLATRLAGGDRLAVLNLATVRRADVIFVLDNGHITERGTTTSCSRATVSTRGCTACSSTAPAFREATAPGHASARRRSFG
jgi:hypothetical protein